MKIKKIIFVFLLIGILLTIPGPKDLQIMASKVKPSLTIVVDAGHGVPDGGAEGSDGTLEATLNLAIAKAIEREGSQRGIKVILTRTTEEGLYTNENVEKKWKKLEDLQCRKTIMDSSKANLAISVHMNAFPSDTSVHGAQVFYPKSGNAEVLTESERLAESIQRALVKGLADGSNRSHMGKGNVYLLENPSLPIALVECGFLSNCQDLGTLKQEKWQRKVAVCILDGIQSYMEI